MPLNSETTVQIVDALCEGPIYGLVGAHEHSIYLNETPIRDKARKGDNEGWNFPDNSVDWDHSLGGRSQNVPYLEDNTVVNTTVNVEVGSNYSEVLNEFNEVKSRDYGEGEVIRTITDPEVDRVKLLFTIPKLFCTAMEGLAKGQMFWASIDIKIYIQSAGGNWKKQQEKSLKGISVSNYQWDSSEIDLEGEGP
jgi:predicted phage tail protein